MCGACHEDRPLNAGLKCDMPETLTSAMLAQLEVVPKLTVPLLNLETDFAIWMLLGLNIDLIMTMCSMW